MTTDAFPEREIRQTPFSRALQAAVAATGLLPAELDELARNLVSCTCFGELIGSEPGFGAQGGYVPSICTSIAGGADLVAAYNAARAAQGDQRRAFAWAAPDAETRRRLEEAFELRNARA